MPSESLTCQSCSNKFALEEDDLAFYKKIDVPPPTWCPDCRMVRRFLFRNERTWYRRKCDATGQNILSMFSPEQPYVVYEHEYWKSDAWDPLSYGKAWDSSKNFLEQFRELFVAVPHPNLIQKNNINSEYSNYTLNLKNCYLIASADTAEDSAYLQGTVLRTRQSLDLYESVDSEFSYELVECSKSNELRFAQNCEGCADSWLLYDCKNCSDCVGCVGLRGKQYHIFNQPFAREEYLRKLEEMQLGSREGLETARGKFETLKFTRPRKYASINRSERVVGEDILNARNCYRCFSTKNDAENCRYCYRVVASKEGMDAFVAWNGAEFFYEIVSASSQRTYFSAYIWGGFDIFYSYNCFDCNNIFGCVGLRNKSYCILNRQYSKEEYEEMLPKIVASMKERPFVDSLGRKYAYGEFFPSEFSPHAYNETVAQDYFPTTRAKAEAKGFRWQDPAAKRYDITLVPGSLPGRIQDVDDSILNETIGCEHAGTCADQCATAFRIIPEELQFYRRLNLPLPRLCPACRHGNRVRSKNPLSLWHRKCNCTGKASREGGYENTATHFHGAEECAHEFETAYSPQRPEILYCEQCYQAETV